MARCGSCCRARRWPRRIPLCSPASFPDVRHSRTFRRGWPQAPPATFAGGRRALIPNSLMCVKSEAHNSPGVCFWPKYTSFAGPSVARHSLIRRCSVRVCPSANRPGYSRCSHSNSVLESRPGLSSICCRTCSQTSLTPGILIVAGQVLVQIQRIEHCEGESVSTVAKG
jgi:hypothetical protein